MVRVYLPPGSGFGQISIHTGLPSSLRRSDNNAPGFLATDLQRELLLGSALGIGPVGDERQATISGTSGADKPRLKVFFDARFSLHGRPRHFIPSCGAVPRIIVSV